MQSGREIICDRSATTVNISAITTSSVLFPAQGAASGGPAPPRASRDRTASSRFAIMDADEYPTAEDGVSFFRWAVASLDVLLSGDACDLNTYRGEQFGVDGRCDAGHATTQDVLDVEGGLYLERGEPTPSLIDDCDSWSTFLTDSSSGDSGTAHSFLAGEGGTPVERVESTPSPQNASSCCSSLDSLSVKKDAGTGSIDVESPSPQILGVGSSGRLGIAAVHTMKGETNAIPSAVSTEDDATDEGGGATCNGAPWAKSLAQLARESGWCTPKTPPLPCASLRCAAAETHGGADALSISSAMERDALEPAVRPGLPPSAADASDGVARAPEFECSEEGEDTAPRCSTADAGSEASTAQGLYRTISNFTANNMERGHTDWEKAKFTRARNRRRRDRLRINLRDLEHAEQVESTLSQQSLPSVQPANYPEDRTREETKRSPKLPDASYPHDEGGNTDAPKSKQDTESIHRKEPPRYATWTTANLKRAKNRRRERLRKSTLS